MKMPGFIYDPAEDGPISFSGIPLFTITENFMGNSEIMFREIPLGFSPIGDALYGRASNLAYTDSMAHWTWGFNSYIPTKQDVVVRLQNVLLNHSYTTIHFVNRFFSLNGYKTQTSRNKFIKEHSSIQWKHCKISNWFVPISWITPTNNYLYSKGKRIKVACFVDTPIETHEEFMQRNEPPLLKNYNTKATDYFQFKVGKKVPKPIFMGIELELEGASIPVIKATNDLLKHHCIIKRDGSLREGLEICSAPATLDVHTEEFKSFFEKIPGDLSAKSSCGMHVHVEKKHLSALQLGKIIKFINDPNNLEAIVKVAGRQPNNYCARKDRKVSSFFTNKQTFSKYEMVNMSPSETLEFRIFASTTDYKTFCKNLEFCKALIDYTAPSACHATSLKDMLMFGTFKQYVMKQHKKTYPHLQQFLSENI